MSYTVQLTIKKKSDISGNISHDLRIKKPTNYELRRKHLNNAIFLKSRTTNESQLVELNDDMKEIIGEFQTTFQNQINEDIEDMKEDYKKHKGKKMPSNTSTTLEGLIYFGASQEKRSLRDEEFKDLEGLLDSEVDEIHAQDNLDLCAQMTIEKLEKDFGIRASYLSVHNDEKIKHYHFIAPNYNFEKHQTLYQGMGKKEIASFGEILQDIVGEIFDEMTNGVIKRPLKYSEREFGAKKTQKDLRKMHAQEVKDLSNQCKQLTSSIAEKDFQSQEIHEFLKDSDRLYRNMSMEKNSAINSIKGLEKQIEILQDSSRRGKRYFAKYEALQNDISKHLEHAKHLEDKLYNSRLMLDTQNVEISSLKSDASSSDLLHSKEKEALQNEVSTLRNEVIERKVFMTNQGIEKSFKDKDKPKEIEAPKEATIDFDFGDM